MGDYSWTCLVLFTNIFLTFFMSFKNRDTKEKGLIFTFHMGPLYIMPKGQFMIVCSRETIINLQVDPTTRLARLAQLVAQWLSNPEI